LAFIHDTTAFSFEFVACPAVSIADAARSTDSRTGPKPKRA
jgi:hypothetical protein